MVAYETGVAMVADPLGGSAYLEALTDELERQAEAIFAQLDEWGDGSILEGVYAGIDANWFQSEIAEAAYQLQRKLMDGRQVLVGVNRFTEGDDGESTPILSIDAAVEEAQRKRLQEVKAHRSADAVEQSLASVRAAAAEADTNLMPAIIEAAGAYATVGEIMTALGRRVRPLRRDPGP